YRGNVLCRNPVRVLFPFRSTRTWHNDVSRCEAEAEYTSTAHNVSTRELNLMSDQSSVRLRSDIPVEETWDLSQMFADDEAWQAAAEAAPAAIVNVAAYRGRFHEGPAVIREALDAYYSLEETLGKLIVYALLRRDEDQTNTESLTRADKAIQINVLA